METNELRIGNWISLGSRIGYIQSNYSEEQYIVVDEEETQDTIEHVDRFKPIELTEEWMLKFGFKVIQKVYFSKSIDDNFYIALNPDGFWLAAREYEDEFSDYHPEVGSWLGVEYIHQLQNLYFALTGVELKSR